MQYTCLSIAGFDGSGGAGIQADLKTFSALGCYGMTVLTAIPIQNTCGVKKCYDLPLTCIADQLEAIFEDIVPNSIKIGMLFSTPIIECVSDFLEKHAPNIPIVLDPVMMAKSGDPLLLPEAMESLKTRLIPLATIITPNLPEAYAITQSPPSDMTQLAETLMGMHAQNVLLKGGHQDQHDQSNDLLLQQNHSPIWLHGPRIPSKNTHGTGCTLSAAIAAFLAQGSSLEQACRQAKKYLLGAIQATQHSSVGKGQGPVHHFYAMWEPSASEKSAC